MAAAMRKPAPRCARPTHCSKSSITRTQGLWPWAGDRDRVYASYTSIYKRICKREDLVDAASEMSFPASDPPSYMGGSSVVGTPDHNTPTEHPLTKVSDRETVKEVSPTDGTGTGGQTQGNTVRKTKP